MDIVVDRSPDDVWAVVGEPLWLIQYFPETDSRMEGEIRILAMGGLEIRERILDRDDDARRYDYEIVSAPFELDSHHGFMQVDDDGGRSRITWGTDVEPDEMEGMFAPMFDQVLAQVKDALEGG
jgi:hypothetical protein